ncbi:MAG: tetratricopeptide repeat protein [Polyangiaceae bacterium]
MRRLPLISFALGLALTVAVGCGGSDKPEVGKDGKPVGPVDHTGAVVKPEAAALYNKGLAEMDRLDKAANGWTTETCGATAKIFLDAADAQGKFFASAFYNAGVSYHRCNNIEEAKKLYKKVLDEDPKFHRARVQIARFDLAASNDTATDAAMAEFERAIADSEFQNVEALVELARLQMRRNNNAEDKDGANDFDRAKKNLQRALAVDDSYMPAFNQLALYYFERAKQAAGAKGTTPSRGGATRSKVDSQAIDLALLVASQGIRKNPNYAAIHNTAGLIYVETGDLNNAVRRFGSARQLDPNFFEAHMNYASVNMLFRGFNKAEEAYRAAIKLRPNDYDAQLGLALSLRGQIDTAPDSDAKLNEAEQLISKAQELDADRPEAYFNHAILVQEYKSRAGGEAGNKALEQAISLFEEFVKRAKGKPQFADAVEDVTAVPTKADKDCLGPKAKEDKACKRGRILDIKETIDFNRQSAAEQKKLEEEAKNRAALEEAGAADAAPQ